MPTVWRDREVVSPRDEVWQVVSDPHHLPRWWPRVRRVEAVDRASWTAVLGSERGKDVRADFRLLENLAPRERSWAQELAGTPFERLLTESVTSIRLEEAGDGTRVRLGMTQRLRGLNRLGGVLVARATRRLLDEALDGLEVACAR